MKSSLHKTRDVVLVVDDSPETLSMLNDVLDSENLTVLVALEGSQALTIANNITPDIILMDAVMPHMDGFETCKQLKSNPEMAHIPVIFMTGLSDTESVVKGFDAGGVDYVTKPIKTDELIARMRVHLANAKLTLSARAALDSAGQYLFSANENGDIIWSTPQVQLLLNQDCAAEEWLAKDLPRHLRPLLADHTDRKKIHISEGLKKAVEIRYLGQTGADEFLLRLIDPERPSESEVLKSAFALTNREAEVLLWIGRGKTNREIGLILSMSPRTVNKHLEQVFRKLGVENRTTAAAMSIRHLNAS
jgi:DNA-binding NarL/FixJ family response regulator